MKPRIGVTRGSAIPIRRFELYTEAVEAAGAEVVVLERPLPAGELDGLLLPGGADIEPLRYDQRPDPRLHGVDAWRDELELGLTRDFAGAGRPVLAICRGLQVVNVALGGTLLQHVEGHDGGVTHAVEVEPWSAFGSAAGGRRLTVNSFHHQAADRIAPGLRVSACCSDGVVEGLESADGLVVAVQCHPERMAGEAWSQRLFRSFVERASARG